MTSSTTSKATREVRVRVAVRPGARRERFIEVGPHRFEANVKEPALRGAANARVRALIALRYGISERAVRFLTGARSPHKTFTVVY